MYDLTHLVLLFCSRKTIINNEAADQGAYPAHDPVKFNDLKTLVTFILGVAGLVGSAAAADGFYTSGSKLMDANGNEFMMRGVNYSWAWQRGNEYMVIPAAKRIGCNVIRIQLSDGARWTRCSAADLERLIGICEENKLVAVFNTHDETGSDNYADLERAVNFWKEMKDVLNAHRKTVLVNISNEWYGSWGVEPWAEGYKKAIPALRDAGILNTLVVDCAGYGQYPNSIFQKGAEVAAADSHNNTIFSMHFYQDAAPTDYKVRSNIDYALNVGVPVIIGEFACEHQGKSIAWQTILDYSKEKSMGWMVWSWTGNGGDTASCDMFGGYDESYYKPNGTNTVKGRNGIQETSVECSVFGNGGGGDDPVDPVEPGETIVWEPEQYIATWDDLCHIEKSMLGGDLTSKDKVRLYVTCDSGAEVQVVYKLTGDDWNKYIDYAPISGSEYDIPMTDATLLRGVNTDGIYLKGHGYKIHKVAVVRPGLSGVSMTDAGDESARQIDFSMPHEIYTMEGVRVDEMQAGRLYIVRQGSKVKKVMR